MRGFSYLPDLKVVESKGGGGAGASNGADLLFSSISFPRTKLCC